MTQTEIREMLVLGDAVVVTVADLDKFKGEMQRRIEAERERDQLATELNETHVDENGTAWTRPTAWAYMQVCKARDKHADRVKTLEDALQAYMFCEQTDGGKNPHRVGTNIHRAFELGRKALAAKEPK